MVILNVLMGRKGIRTFVWMHSVSYVLKYVNFSDEQTALYVPPIYVNMKYAFLIYTLLISSVQK